MARKEKKYHFIYKTTNLLSGKYYIGMHSTDNLDDGYMGSGNRIRLAIRKHGKENFNREIIEFVESRAELKLREEEIITLDEIAKQDCMNLKVGGEGGWHKAANNKFKWLLENDVEFKENFSKTMRKITTERMKMGFTMPNYDWTGKRHSDETKKKISEVKKGKGTGKTNSQYGTCWITNGEINKKVNKEELETYLHNGEGWRTGRVIAKKHIEKLNKVMESKRKVKRPPYEQLLEEVKELGYAGTGRKYGVTYGAIKKWVLHYEKNTQNL